MNVPITSSPLFGVYVGSLVLEMPMKRHRLGAALCRDLELSVCPSGCQCGVTSRILVGELFSLIQGFDAVDDRNPALSNVYNIL